MVKIFAILIVFMSFFFIAWEYSFFQKAKPVCRYQKVECFCSPCPPVLITYRKYASDYVIEEQEAIQNKKVHQGSYVQPRECIEKISGSFIDSNLLTGLLIPSSTPLLCLFLCFHGHILTFK